MNELKTPKKTISFYEKLAIGAGGITDFNGNVTVKSNAAAFLNMLLGLPLSFISWVIVIPNLWDSITDPIVGKISDRYYSKYGKRRPFIFLGAILTGASFGLIWMVPENSTNIEMFIWFLITSIIFYTCFTIFSIPFVSLTLEISSDYHERSSIQAYVRLGCSIAEMIYKSIIPISLLLVGWKMLNSDLKAVQFVMWIYGFLIIAFFGVIPAIFVQERHYKVRSNKSLNKKISFSGGIKEILSNKAFLILIILLLLQVVAAMFASTLDEYVLCYYMFDGTDHLQKGLKWKAILSSQYAVFGIIGIPLILTISKKIGKLKTLKLVYIIVIFKSVLRWLIFTPDNHYFIVIDAIFGAFYLLGLGVIKISMIADICDYDEFTYGKSRRGMFASIYSWANKTIISLSIIIGFSALSYAGFNQELGINQSQNTIMNMRLLMVFGELIPNILALIIVHFYPLTKEKSLKISIALNQLHNR